MNRLLFALLIALSCLTAWADEPLRAELSPDQESATLRNAEAVGLSIYRHDRAAELATDAALKLRAFKKDKRLQGWITEERDGQITVTFLDQSPAALYRATVSNAGVVGGITVLDAPQTLTAFEAGAAGARAVAMASGFQPCSDKYNSVVLPQAGGRDDEWVVYLLPGTTKKNVIPVGGTHRVHVKNGSIVSSRGFTRTCITLQFERRTVGVIITHIMDTTPTEAHVFWSLWAHKPMYVATASDTVWTIEGGEIRLDALGD